MNRKGIKYIISILLLTAVIFVSPVMAIESHAAFDSYPWVFLSTYYEELSIGDEFYLIAVTSMGKKATFKSSDSSIASVNTYGLVTAKKAGSCKITAKIKDAEASCQVVVKKTQVRLEYNELSMENGKTKKIRVWSSTGHNVKWKSSKNSVARVSENGVITSKKPGNCEITATVDGTSAICKLTVKFPTVKLNKANVSLYRKQTVQLQATVSSGREVTWKTNKKSVAVVDEKGVVTAIKHGEAVISATVDGVTKQCKITVKQPTIKLSETELSMKEGDRHFLKATVSSGNEVQWSSSNPEIVTVNGQGVVRAKKKGKAYVYAKEDGVKARCTVKVTK